jgi:hypothetical protein
MVRDWRSFYLTDECRLVQGVRAAFATSVPIVEQCTSFMQPDFSSSTRPIGGGAKQQEESMFKMTKGDLAQKSDAQLAALFLQATLGLSATKSDIATAQSQLAMIRAELAARAPR